MIENIFWEMKTRLGRQLSRMNSRTFLTGSSSGRFWLQRQESDVEGTKLALVSSAQVNGDAAVPPPETGASP
ncbi:MAG: hypothetical protein Q8L54_01210 [Devosia sp.]|nr:hypothetical protein [Devosia sp.]